MASARAAESDDEPQDLYRLRLTLGCHGRCMTRRNLGEIAIMRVCGGVSGGSLRVERLRSSPCHELASRAGGSLKVEGTHC